MDAYIDQRDDDGNVDGRVTSMEAGRFGTSSRGGSPLQSSPASAMSAHFDRGSHDFMVEVA
jgi:hypothetical protein